jgi:hypothetical protein
MTGISSATAALYSPTPSVGSIGALPAVPTDATAAKAADAAAAKAVKVNLGAEALANAKVQVDEATSTTLDITV